MIHKIINGIVFLSLTTAAIPSVASDFFTATLENLAEEELRRKSDSTKYKNLVVNYKDLTNKSLMVVRNKPSSVVFSKVVMCGNQSYPTIIVRTIRNDSQDEYSFRDTSFIFNELLEELANDYETTLVSNQPSGAPDKFKVIVQPKFTLETIEEFVCSSQVSICKTNEKVEHQCTFSDGRQANMCSDKELYPHIMRIGKPLKKLEKEYRIPELYTLHHYEMTKENSKGGLSGISNSLSFTEDDMNYSFENHWSTRSRDDYDFHAEFNVRKDGKIIESHRCIEGSYD